MLHTSSYKSSSYKDCISFIIYFTLKLITKPNVGDLVKKLVTYSNLNFLFGSFSGKFFKKVSEQINIDFKMLELKNNFINLYKLSKCFALDTVGTQSKISTIAGILIALKEFYLYFLN